MQSMNVNSDGRRVPLYPWHDKSARSIWTQLLLAYRVNVIVSLPLDSRDE